MSDSMFTEQFSLFGTGFIQRNIAIIDTETNWDDQVMSIGIVIADGDDFGILDSAYYVLTPEFMVTGMFSNQLFTEPEDRNRIFTREEAISDMKDLLKKYEVKNLFAYNAHFDSSHLPEFSNYKWYDILKIAAYRQYNFAITDCMECCNTGRLKRNYSVEAIYNMLAVDSYNEEHNALQDAIDELEIMKMLKQPLSVYTDNAGI